MSPIEDQSARFGGLLTLLKRYRLLLLVYGLASVVAAWEIAYPGPNADEVNDKAILPADADALVALWPDHADAHFVRNIQARFLRFDLQEAREHLERGLAQGPKSTERLIYEYAYVLVLMGAPAAEIEAAVSRWRRNFPYSELKDPRSLQEPPFPAPGIAASHWIGALSPDGVTYARIRLDEAVEFWNVANGSVAVIPPSPDVNAKYLLGFSPDGKTLAVVGHSNAVHLVDVQSTLYATVLQGHNDAAYSVAFSSDGSKCATGSADHTIRLWDATYGKQLRVFTDHSRTVSALAISNDGKRMASGDWQGTIMLRQLESDHTLTLSGHSGAIAALALSPDGRTLASASRDSTVRLWDTVTGELKHTLDMHSAPVCTVTFSPDGRLVASGGADNTVQSHVSATGEILQSVKTPAAVFSVMFFDNSRTVAVACVDNSVRRINMKQPDDQAGIHSRINATVVVCIH